MEPASKPRVLIVDDSRVSTKTIDDALSSDIYRKRSATNGQEGLDVYRTWNPDIIFLDIMMPIVSGFAVLKEIREREKTEPNAKKTAVIMITALADKGSITDCLKLGIQGYLVKPFPLEEVARRAEDALRKMSGDPGRNEKPAS